MSEGQSLPGEIPGLGASPDGTRATDVAATEARAAGRGEISLVARPTGIAYSTIMRGLKELASGDHAAAGRARRPGGGRRCTIEKDPTLLADLEALVEPTASGDPESPLRWTSKSVRQLPLRHRPWAMRSAANW